MEAMRSRPDSSNVPARFLTTRWSLVLAAGEATSPRSREALESLCTTSWYPLYAFARRKGANAENAADLVQGFFASVLARNDLAALSPDRGRFRSFLLASFTHFMANERDRERALRRGGGVPPIAIDAAGADTRYRNEPSHDLTPEREFERTWALEILSRTFDALSAEYTADGKSALFEALKPELQGASESSYADVAARLGTTEGAIKTAASRLRKRWREILRAEIAGTLSDPANVDDELRGLFTALSS